MRSQKSASTRASSMWPWRNMSSSRNLFWAVRGHATSASMVADTLAADSSASADSKTGMRMAVPEMTVPSAACVMPISPADSAVYACIIHGCEDRYSNSMYS